MSLTFEISSKRQSLNEMHERYIFTFNFQWHENNKLPINCQSLIEFQYRPSYVIDTVRNNSHRCLSVRRLIMIITPINKRSSDKIRNVWMRGVIEWMVTVKDMLQHMGTERLRSACAFAQGWLEYFLFTFTIYELWGNKKRQGKTAIRFHKFAGSSSVFLMFAYV